MSKSQTGHLRPDRRHAPTVVLQDDGLVMKSYDNCPVWLRHTVGRLAVSREWWALRQLEGSRHAPRAIARPNPWSIVTEYIPGIPLESLNPGTVDPHELLREARSLLDDLAKSGVVHADLGHDHWQSFGRECNLIWSDRKALVAIDFAGALPLSSNPLTNRFAQLLRGHDLLLESKIVFHFGADLGGKRAPQVEWSPGTWELLRFLGKI